MCPLIFLEFSDCCRVASRERGSFYQGSLTDDSSLSQDVAYTIRQSELTSGGAYFQCCLIHKLAIEMA